VLKSQILLLAFALLAQSHLATANTENGTPSETPDGRIAQISNAIAETILDLEEAKAADDIVRMEMIKAFGRAKLKEAKNLAYQQTRGWWIPFESLSNYLTDAATMGYYPYLVSQIIADEIAKGHLFSPSDKAYLAFLTVLPAVSWRIFFSYMAGDQYDAKLAMKQTGTSKTLIRLWHRVLRLSKPVGVRKSFTGPILGATFWTKVDIYIRAHMDGRMYALEIPNGVRIVPLLENLFEVPKEERALPNLANFLRDLCSAVMSKRVRANTERDQGLP
jgi:hypothetical protein